MMRKIVVAATVVTTSLVLTGLGLGAGSAGTKFTASLNTAQEVPKPSATAGTGRFTGTLTGRSLSWKLTFTKLTGSADAAHIHLGKRGKAGPVAVALCGPCRSGVRGKAKLSASVVRALKTGGAYVNVHTAKNANGEIRGQIRKAA
jgi:hypothetical protein